jgi:microtubule-associated protein-like 6
MVSIYVWNIETKEIIAHLKGFHKGAVNILRFSPDGSKLLAIGKDNNNSLAIFDWAHERLICQSKVDQNFVTDAAWKNNNEFVTVGKKHIKFFETKGTSIKFRRGRWGSYPSEALSSAVFCFP